MDRAALYECLGTALRQLDAGDPLAAWTTCADTPPAIRALDAPLDRAILIGRVGIVAAAVGDPFTAVVCREEALAFGRAGADADRTELGLVLERLEGVCCTLDHHPTLP